MRRVVNRSSGIGGNQHSHAEHACQLSGSANLACEVRLEARAAIPTQKRASKEALFLVT